MLQADLKKKLYWITFLRVLVITTLVLSTLLTRDKADAIFWRSILTFMLSVAGFTVLLTAAVLITLSRTKSFRALRITAYAQIVFDVAINTALVLVTGGATSLFTFLFSLTIINASTLLYRPGAVVAALLSAVGYGGIILVELSVLPQPAWIQLSLAEDIYNSLSINVITFVAVAMLAGQLSEQLRTTRSRLEQSEISLTDLRILNDMIVNSLEVAIITLSGDGRVILCNRWLQLLTGFESGEVLYRPIEQVFPPLTELIDAAGRRPVQHEDVELARRDGETFVTRVSVFPLLKKGKERVGTVLSIQDLTSFREMERRIKKHERLAAVGELSAGIAHEIRNPLAAISGSVQMLLDNPKLDDAEQRLMRIVVKESDYLNGLIGDFLAYARPSTMEVSAVDVVPLIAETLQMCTAGASEMLTTRLGGASVAYVCGDRRQLRQVLWNLFTNSIDAMPDGGTISVEITEGTPRLPMVQVTVSDTGKGIPDDVIDRIFTPFFTTKDRGTGLGLATVHAIVEHHGGTIQVESDKHGTTFRLLLPMATAALIAGEEPSQRGEAA